MALSPTSRDVADTKENSPSVEARQTMRAQGRALGR